MLKLLGNLSSMDPANVVRLLREAGVYNLGGIDGCGCTSFQVHNLDVEVLCRKASGGPLIKVSSGSLDWTEEKDLAAVAEEVKRQVLEDCSFYFPEGDIPILLEPTR